MKLFRKKKHISPEKRSPFFFDAADYPDKWHTYTDEELVELFQTTKNQLIICLLLQRHKGAIIGISLKFLKSKEMVIDFSHNLYEKLIHKIGDREINNFQAFLVTMIGNMHKDDYDKAKVRTLYTKKNPSNNVYSDEVRNDFKLDNPLNPEKLESMYHDKVFSKMEYECLKLLLQSYKPSEIASMIDPEILGISTVKQWEPNKLLKVKTDKVYAALERAKKKVKTHLGTDFQDYFKTN